MRKQRAHSFRSDECDLEDLADGGLEILASEHIPQPPNLKRPKQGLNEGLAPGPPFV